MSRCSDLAHTGVVFFFGITPTAHSGGTAENLSAETCNRAWRRIGRRPRPGMSSPALWDYVTSVCEWLGECANESRGQNVLAVGAREVAVTRASVGLLHTSAISAAAPESRRANGLEHALKL